MKIGIILVYSNKQNEELTFKTKAFEKLIIQ